MNHRQIGVLRLLLRSRDYQSGQVLADRFEVSVKTIYSDLLVLQEFLTPYDLVLKKVPRHGVCILGPDSLKESLCQALDHQVQATDKDHSFWEREDVYLKSLFLLGHSLSILDLSLDLFVSEISIRRDLEKLDMQLADYNCQLIRHNGFVSLEGDELACRHFFRNRLIEKYAEQLNSHQSDGLLAFFFDQENVEGIIKAVQEASDLYAYTISEQYRIYLILDLLIATRRYQQGYLLRPQPLPIGQDMALFGVYPFAGDLLCYSLNRPVDTLLPEEVKQLSLTILSVGYESFPSENQQFVQLTKQLIERVGHLSGLDLSHDTDLVKMISNHLRPMVYRLKNGINIANQTTEEIKKRYSILFHVVWLASKVLSDQYQLELLDAEIAFLTIYFEIAVEKLEKPLTIVIVCPHGLATSELIISSLRRLISHYDHLVTVDLSELDSSVARQADILISSIQLKDFPLPYVLVSPVLTNDELDNIQKLYLDLTKGNRKVLSIVHDDYDAKQALLKDLIQQEVYLHQALTSQEDCLRFLAQHAFSENRDNPGYLTSILQREKMGSTSVYTGIALPHANPEMVGRSQLSLLTLKEPVIWGKNRVKVVMLISIKEGEEELYKEALVQLYSKIDNEAFIDSLSQMADEKAFIELLLKKEED